MQNPFPRWLSFRNCLLGLLGLNILAAILVYFLLLSLPFFLSFSIMLLVSIMYLALIVIAQFQALYDGKKWFFALLVLYWVGLIGVTALGIFFPESPIVFVISLVTTAVFTGFVGAMTLLSASPAIQLVPYVFFLIFTLFIWWISERSQKA